MNKGFHCERDSKVRKGRVSLTWVLQLCMTRLEKPIVKSSLTTYFS